MDKKYKNTKLKLSALYFGIVLIIVIFFSIVIVQNQFSQISRIEDYREFEIQRNIQFLPLSPEDQAFQNVIDDIRNALLLRIIETDIAILMLSAALSYYLAGKTLEPIEEAFEKQKKFVANASHELKTPLTTITTEAEVLLRSDRTNEQYKEFTKSVLEEAQRLTQLTIQLLGIAKSDSHTTKLNLKDFDLTKTIIDEINKFETIAEQRNIELIFKHPKEDVIFNCDREKIIQLIDIVLDNAIKYNKESGKVIVTLKKNDRKILIIIEDTGIGIAKENIDKVFDRFYRTSDDRNQKGFGLGLSIAQEIVEECNGIIEIESEPKRGTKVILRFN